MSRWKTFKEPVIWLAGLLALITALLWADSEFYGPGSQAYEHARQENPQPTSTLSARADDGTYELQYQTQAEHQEAQFLGRSAETWIALLTLVLAASTIALWLETRRLAQHAELEARESNRPIPLMLIGVDDPAIWDDRSVIVRGHLKNVGPIPAFVSSCVAEALLWPAGKTAPIPKRDGFPMSDREGFTMSLLTGLRVIETGDDRYLDYWPNVAFSSTDREAYLAGDLEVYFVGHVAYSDPSGRQREVGFCYKLERRNAKDNFPEHLARALDPGCNYDRPAA